MDENTTVKTKRSWAKTAGVAFLIYLTSFGVFVALDSIGVLPRPCPVLYYAYLPLIWVYMAIL